jgi:hypothetical protein
MAAHRYWRLNITAINGGSLIRIDEIELSEAAHGTSVAAGGTAAASSTFSGSFLAENAFTGALGDSSWATPSGTTTGWISYDFGSGVTKEIASVVLNVFASDTDRMPTAFDVQYSDDNSSWTTAWSVSSATGWAAGERRAFSNNGYGSNTQSWRISVADSSGLDGAASLQIASFVFRTTSGGSDQASGGVAFGSLSKDLTTLPNKLVDANAATFFQTVSSSFPATAGYKFSAAITIVEITITAGPSVATGSPKTFDVQYWDGSAWQTKWTVTGSSGWTTGLTRTFTDPSPGFGSAASTSDFFSFL